MSDGKPERPSGPPSGKGGRPPQVCIGFTSYQMWKVDNEWRRKGADEKLKHIKEFHAACESVRPTVEIESYTTLGFRADTDFILWNKAKTMGPLHDMGVALAGTELSKWMTLTHQYTAMLKGSPYAGAGEEKGKAPEGKFEYLFIYPFVKTRAWYLLPFEERYKIMKEHIDKSREYDDFRINTSYSFGIDDQDFVVAFEGNKPDRFVDLVQGLRETESSKYTQRDTPMYVGMRSPLDRLLSIL